MARERGYIQADFLSNTEIILNVLQCKKNSCWSGCSSLFISSKDWKLFWSQEVIFLRLIKPTVTDRKSPRLKISYYCHRYEIFIKKSNMTHAFVVLRWAGRKVILASPFPTPIFRQVDSDSFVYINSQHLLIPIDRWSS